MRIQELIEAPLDIKTRQGVDNWARNQGYKFKATGSDARVYTSGNNTIIKVLVGSDGIPTTQAARGFLAFYNFCKQHPNHPNLPRFFGEPKTQSYGNEDVVHIEMERLQELDKRMKNITEDLVAHIGSKWEDLAAAERDEVSAATWGMLKKPFEGEQAQWQEFFKLLNKLYKYFNQEFPAGKSSLSTRFDMEYGENVMQRNGIPVIIDPFVA